MDNTLPSFSLSLVIVDYLPVLFFFLATYIIAKKIRNIHKLGGNIFSVGSLIFFIGGFLQATWKLIIVLFKKNISILHSQFKYSMLTGILLMITGVIISRSQIQWNVVKYRLFSMPCILFLIIIVVSISISIVFMFILDSNNITGHWIKECVQVIYNGNLFLCALYGTKSNKAKKINI